MKSQLIEKYSQKFKNFMRSLGIPAALLTVIPILLDGCHKDAIAPVSIDIKFGTEGLVNGGWTFASFKNQNQISAGDLLASTKDNPFSQGIEIALIESGVPCNRVGSINSVDLGSLEFLFNISTSSDVPRDREIFVTGKNGSVTGFAGGSNPNNNCTVQAWYVFPIKLSSHFTVNNDTLEINPLDTVKINYRSLYTSKTFSSTLAVTR